MDTTCNWSLWTECEEQCTHPVWFVVSQETKALMSQLLFISLVLRFHYSLFCWMLCRHSSPKLEGLPGHLGKHHRVRRRAAPVQTSGKASSLNALMCNPKFGWCNVAFATLSKHYRHGIRDQVLAACMHMSRQRWLLVLARVAMQFIFLFKCKDHTSHTIVVVDGSVGMLLEKDKGCFSHSEGGFNWKVLCASAFGSQNAEEYLSRRWRNCEDGDLMNDCLQIWNLDVCSWIFVCNNDAVRQRRNCSKTVYLVFSSAFLLHVHLSFRFAVKHTVQKRETSGTGVYRGKLDRWAIFRRWDSMIFL